MTNDQLESENAELRARMEELEETLRAIREGEVDAVVVTGSKGDRIFALSEAENLPRLMVETMNEAGLAVTPGGLVVFANDRAAELLGRERNRLLGHDLGDLVIPAHRDQFRQLLRSEAAVDTRIEFAGAIGTPVPMHVWASRLDRAGGPLICLVATDLTRIEADRTLIYKMQEQQRQLRASRVAALNLMQDAVSACRKAEQAEAAVRESEERLRVATESARAGMWSMDIQAQRWEFSPQAARVFGLPDREPPTFERIMELTHPDDRAMLAEQSVAALDSAGEHEFEYRIVRPDGAVRWVLLRGRTDADADGRPWRNMGVVMDITQRQQAEEAARKTAVKLESVVSVSPTPCRDRAQS